ncbi:MAG: ATP-binding protein, partial [Acidobacteriota bacterium]|nr:ATP-binding protein [Acidobacteriota bacterium]
LVRERLDPVDVGALLTRIVEGFRLRESGRAELHFDVIGGPHIVEATEDRLTQVFENILDNALSFTPDGAAVRVDVVSENTEVVARISDEGPGIPEANLARIFDRFFSHRPDARRHAGGHTGLGLAIVKTIVEAYGGTVSAANGAAGAVFTIRLPRS